MALDHPLSAAELDELDAFLADEAIEETSMDVSTLEGFQFNDEAWSLLAVGRPTWFTPFLRLGTDEGIDITQCADDAEQWVNEIEPSLLRIHAYWQEHATQQSAKPAGPEFPMGGLRD